MGEKISKEFIDKVFPHLDLKNRKETEKKLINLLESLEVSRRYYEDLAGDETQENDELIKTYDAYKFVIEKILPSGYILIEEKMPRSSELWRGTDPLKIFSLMSDTGNALKIESDFPNVAHKWSTSLGYGHGRDTLSMPFVLAMGFARPKDLVTKNRKEDDKFKDTIETTEGEINFNNLRELAIRLKGKEPGQVFPPKFYKINKIEGESLAA